MASYYDGFVATPEDEPNGGSEPEGSQREASREEEWSQWQWNADWQGGWDRASWRSTESWWHASAEAPRAGGPNENWSWREEGSESRSEQSWGVNPPRQSQWGRGGGGSNSQGTMGGGRHYNWEVDEEQRTVPEAGFDRHGNLPSGEVTSAGDRDSSRREGDGTKSKGKPSSSYPPIFKAKAGESYRDWKRAVGFWLGGEGNQIPVEYIGPRIMVQLRERAAQLVKHLNNEDVNGSDGMQKIFDTLERSPLVRQLDKHRVDQHRKRLMSLSRQPGESLESYVTRGGIYRLQLMSLDESLEMGEKFYVGHLLDHARLTRRDKVLVRARAGEETEESITNALVELAAELEGEHGCPIGASEPNVAGSTGEEHLVQRSSGYGLFGRKPGAKAAMAAEVDGSEDDHGSEMADLAEEFVEDDVPVEMMEMEREAYALHFRAKQKMAEVKKLRQYYRKGDSSEERRKALQEKMRNTACHACGEIGHWSRECPKKGGGGSQQALMASACSTRSRARSSRSAMVKIPEGETIGSRQHEWDLLVSLCTGQDGQTDSQERGVYMVAPCARVQSLPETGHEVM